MTGNKIRSPWRHVWIAVLLVGFAASWGVHAWLTAREHAALRTEIAHRSESKLQAVRGLLEQHVHALSSIIAFMDGDMLAHQYVTEDEAVGFLRGLMGLHPGEFAAMALIPAAEHGDTVFLAGDGTRIRRLDPPVAKDELARLTPGEARLILLRGDPARPRLRLLLATRREPRGHAVVDLNAADLLSRAVARGLPAGLDVEVFARERGREARLVRHASRTRTDAAAAGNEAWRWQGGFTVAGLEFVLRTRAAPGLVARFLTWQPLGLLLFGLAFSALAAFYVYSRGRYGERLRQQVDARTTELASERMILRTIMDHAPIGIWYLRKDGRLV